MVIYKITNLINNKCYIGQTIKTAEQRFKEHIKIASDKSKKFIIHKAIIKYGFENFIVEEIDRCLTFDSLNERELYWIEHYQSNNIKFGYNITKGGSGVKLINSINGEQIRKKMSNARKEFYLKNPLARKDISDKQKKRLSDKTKHPMFGKTGVNNPSFGIKRPNHAKLMKGRFAGEKNPMFGKKGIENKNFLNNPSEFELETIKTMIMEYKKIYKISRMLHHKEYVIERWLENFLPEIKKTYYDNRFPKELIIDRIKTLIHTNNKYSLAKIAIIINNEFNLRGDYIIGLKKIKNYIKHIQEIFE